MPNLNDRLRRTWDKTTQLVANEQAQQSFLSATDRNQDGGPPGRDQTAEAGIGPAEVAGQEEQAEQDQDQRGNQAGFHRAVVVGEEGGRLC